MEAKITRADGTVVELKGTAEELRPFIVAEQVAAPVQIPATSTGIDFSKVIEEWQRKASEMHPWFPSYPQQYPQPYRLDHPLWIVNPGQLPTYGHEIICSQPNNVVGFGSDHIQ